MAIARKGGDASVLVKSTETGRIAGRADLKSAKPSAMKALGPVAWQAMALATQQHYLVEINDKLGGVKGAVDELLARLTDDKRAEADELRDEAARIRVKLARGENVDVSSLDNWLHRAGVSRSRWPQQPNELQTGTCSGRWRQERLRTRSRSRCFRRRAWPS